MKNKYWNIICASLFLMCGGTACDDEWYTEESLTGNNKQVEEVGMSAADFLKSEADYSQMLQLFQSQGILDEMQQRGMKYTLFVVGNENLSTLTEDSLYTAQAHITTGLFTPSSLTDGSRLLTWTGRYVDVEKSVYAQNEENDENIGLDSIAISGIMVKRMFKVQDAYIYELDRLIEIPRSLLEILERLPDEEYSLFKGMVGKYAQRTFDREASKVLGINDAGNTIYDSVIVVRYPYFEKNGIDLTSALARMTMLIPNNELLTQAIDRAHAEIASWNEFEENMAAELDRDTKGEITGYSRADSIIEQWCFQCAFFNEELKPEAFHNSEKIDLTSAFGKQWRTTVNKVDTDNPISMSNGTAYYMTSLKVPQNVLIYRIKDYAKFYQYLSDVDKSAFYLLDNMKFNRVTRDAEAWTPGEGWPIHEDISVWFDCADQTTQNCAITFYPYHFHLNGDNSYAVQPYMIPPGEYSFHIGFGNVKNMHGPLDIYVNGEKVRTLLESEISGFSRDRASGGYPEGYNKSLHDKYDRDGGQVAIVTIKEMQRLEIRYQAHGWGDKGNRINPQHFTFRPTANCY